MEIVDEKRLCRVCLFVNPLFRPTYVHLIDLDHAEEAVPIRTNHRASQLLQPRPRRLVAVDPEHAPQVVRIGPVLVSHDFSRRVEPELQRLPRSLENRPGCHTRSAPTIRTERAARRTPRRPVVATGRTHESVRRSRSRNRSQASASRKKRSKSDNLRWIFDALPQANRFRKHDHRYSARWRSKYPLNSNASHAKQTRTSCGSVLAALPSQVSRCCLHSHSLSPATS